LLTKLAQFRTEFSEDQAAAAYQRAVAMLKGLRAADSAAEGRKRERRRERRFVKPVAV
jgi:hypothetical protein